VAKQSSAFDRSRTRKQFAARVRDERAQTMSEYAVILTAITVAVVLAVGLLSTSIGSHITDIANLIR
jgi:Flp pilus assembly pilin Flp